MDQTVSVQIEAVYPRKDRKPPALKTTNGDYFGLPDGYAQLGLAQGMVGEITYWVKQGNQGRQFFNAVKWNGQDIPKGQAQPQQQPLHPQAVVNPPQPMPQPAPQPAAHIADNKDECIFITGVVGRSMQSGQFGVMDIDALTKAARAAWLNRNSGAMEPHLEPQGDPGMPADDPNEIPY